jgi:hypothetical protein
MLELAELFLLATTTCSIAWGRTVHTPMASLPESNPSCIGARVVIVEMESLHGGEST